LSNVLKSKVVDKVESNLENNEASDEYTNVDMKIDNVEVTNESNVEVQY